MLTAIKVQMIYSIQGIDGVINQIDNISQSVLKKAVKSFQDMGEDVSELELFYSELYGKGVDTGRTLKIGDQKEYVVRPNETVDVNVGLYTSNEYVTVEYTEHGPVVVF